MTGVSEIPVPHGGVIAAGGGTRLRADGYRVSKPMAPVGGRPLIEHALDRFLAVGIRRVTIIINDGSDDCRRWLRDHGQDFDLDVIVRTTPSSYASFQLVAGRLADAPAVITTVDTIMPVDDFRIFMKSAARFARERGRARLDWSCRRRESALGDAGWRGRPHSAARRRREAAR